MPRLNRPRQDAAILIVLLALQLFLMSDGAKHSGAASTIESFVMRVSSPCVVLAQAVAGGLRAGVSGAGDLLAAHVRNTVLESEVRQLRRDNAVLVDEVAKLKRDITRIEKIVKPRKAKTA